MDEDIKYFTKTKIMYWILFLEMKFVNIPQHPSYVPKMKWHLYLQMILNM